MLKLQTNSINTIKAFPQQTKPNNGMNRILKDRGAESLLLQKRGSGIEIKEFSMRVFLTQLILFLLFSLTTFAQYVPSTVLSGHTDRVYNVVFSPDGNTLASKSKDKTIRLWDVKSGTARHTLTGHTDSIYRIKFSPDNETLASGSADNTIRLWDIMTGAEKHILIGHTQGVRSVAFSPDGNVLASSSMDNTVRLWDIQNGSENYTLIGNTNYITELLFNPDGNTLVSISADNTIRLWDVQTGIEKHILIGHTNTIWEIILSPDGKTLVSRSADKTVRIWDIQTGIEKHIITVHTDLIYDIELSPDGKTLATRSADKTVRLWDVQTSTEKHLLTTYTDIISDVVFSPDGKTLAGHGRDNTIYLWNVETGVEMHILRENSGYRGHLIPFWDILFRPDGKTLISKSSSSIGIWDVEAGVNLGTLKGHRDSINSVTFSPDGNKLASCSNDMTVRLWELPNTHVSITASAVDTHVIGDVVTLSINISNGENITGYQARIAFDESTLYFIDSSEGDYLSDDSFSVYPVIEESNVTLGATSLISGVSGNGTLATLNFEFIGIKESTITLSDFVIVNSNGDHLPFLLENYGSVLVGVPRLREDINLDGVVDILDLILVADSFGKPALRYEFGDDRGDVNKDGVVDIQDLIEISILNIGLVLDENTSFNIDESTGLEFEDISEILYDAWKVSFIRDPADVNMDGIIDIIDLVLVAGAIGSKAAAPSISIQAQSLLSVADVQNWITKSQHLDLADPKTQRGILFLKQLFENLTPKKTVLLPNYPNPFNPETWIPYHLAKPADVALTIYTADGGVVRTLVLGNQSAGMYQSRSRAAHWDGKNTLGESVASGVYFYTLTVGDFSATRKMLIMK